MDSPLPPVTLLFDLDTLEKMGLDQALLSLRQMGITTYAITRHEIERLPSDETDCWLAFGSISFIRAARRHLTHQPLAYYSDERFYLSRYAHKLPSSWMLNSGGFFLPCASVLDQLPAIERWLDGQAFFMRPDSGAKVFTGQRIEYVDAKRQIESLARVSSLTPDTMVYLAPDQPVEAEYRIFIVNRKVISGSFYSFEETSSGAEIPNNVLSLADDVARHAWQIDIAYSCDIALINGHPKVVELNAGSTSGFYDSDSMSIVLAMMDAAWLEYQGELSIED